MPAEITAALIALAITVIGALSTFAVWLFKMAPGWIERAVERRLSETNEAVAENTALTKEVHTQTNGQLAAARNEAQKYRSAFERSALLLRELNKIPEAKPYIDQAAQAMRRAALDTDWAKLERKLMGEVDK